MRLLFPIPDLKITDDEIRIDDGLETAVSRLKKLVEVALAENDGGTLKIVKRSVFNDLGLLGGDRSLVIPKEKIVNSSIRIFFLA